MRKAFKYFSFTVAAMLGFTLLSAAFFSHHKEAKLSVFQTNFLSKWNYPVEPIVLSKNTELSPSLLLKLPPDAFALKFSAGSLQHKGDEFEVGQKFRLGQFAKVVKPVTQTEPGVFWYQGHFDQEKKFFKFENECEIHQPFKTNTKIFANLKPDWITVKGFSKDGSIALIEFESFFQKGERSGKKNPCETGTLFFLPTKDLAKMDKKLESDKNFISSTEGESVPRS